MVPLKYILGLIFSLFLVTAALVSAGNLQAELFRTDSNPIYEIDAYKGEKGISIPESNSNAGLLDSRPSGKISRGSAMLRSLIIPGWGESYLGYHNTARWFFWADVAIWASVVGFETYSKWKEDQFIAFASTHSGAQMDGKTDTFYADIGNYDSIEEYNAAKLRERNYEALYTSSAYYWSWDSRENRLEYDNDRITSKSAHNKVYFLLGAAALNRLISFIDTGKKARDVLREQSAPQLGFQVIPGERNGSNMVQLVVQANF